MLGERYQHVRTFSNKAHTKKCKKGDDYDNDNNNDDDSDNDNNNNINSNKDDNDNNDTNNIPNGNSTRRLYVLPSNNLTSITHENQIDPIRVRERGRDRGTRRGVIGGEIEREREVGKGCERGRDSRVQENMLTEHIPWFNFNDVKFTKMKDKKVNFSVDNNNNKNSNNDDNITNINNNTNTPNTSIQNAVQQTKQQTIVIVEDLALHHYLHILASHYVQYGQREQYVQYGVVHFLPSNESLKKNSVEVFTNDRNASISGRVIQYQYKDRYRNSNIEKKKSNNHNYEGYDSNSINNNNDRNKHKNTNTGANGNGNEKIHDISVNTNVEVNVEVDVCVCGVWVGCWSEGALWTQILFLLMWDQVNRIVLSSTTFKRIVLC